MNTRPISHPVRILNSGHALCLACIVALGGSSVAPGQATPAPAASPAASAPPVTKSLAVKSDPAGLTDMIHSLHAREGVEITSGEGIVVLKGDVGSVAEVEALVQELDRAQNRVRQDQADMVAHLKSLRDEVQRLATSPTAFTLETGPTLGATLEHVQALLAASGIELNLLWVAEDLAAEPIAKAALKSVTLDTLVAILPRLAGRRPLRFAMELVDPGATRERSGTPRTAAALLAIEWAPAPVVPKQNAEVGPRTLTGRIDGLANASGPQAEMLQRRQADLLAAIEVGLAVLGSRRSTDFAVKLHPPTGMVFCRGTAEEVALIRQVIELSGGTWGP